MKAEGACVDPCEHHLVGARGGYLPSHGNGFGDGGAAAASTGEGYGAVGAEIVAAVLYFEKSSCAVVTRVCQGERPGTFGVGNIVAYFFISIELRNDYIE